MQHSIVGVCGTEGAVRVTEERRAKPAVVTRSDGEAATYAAGGYSERDGKGISRLHGRRYRTLRNTQILLFSI